MTNQSLIETENERSPSAGPTTRRLAQLLSHLSQDANRDALAGPAAKGLQIIRAMVQKYDYDWPRPVGQIIQPVVRERVVVTGTTGALGSHLLAQLLASDSVEKVWAMNRNSSKGNNKERQIMSFKDKLLDVNLLSSDKVVFVDADLEDPKLGLRGETYDEIRSEATIIIHDAWPVNFNHSLETFEPNVRGSRHLLDLAFRSTSPTGLPRFSFLSSMAVTGFDHPGRRLSEVSVAIEDAATSIGYGQSKLVTEKLLESANRAGLETCILRLGQLTGDIKSGSWATSDWVPSLVASSMSVGRWPGALGVASWVPLDVAAHAIIDICAFRNVNIEMPSIAHISHPRPVPWMDLLHAFSSSITVRTGTQLPIIRFSEWNRQIIEASASLKGSKRDRYRKFPNTRIQGRFDREAEVDDELRSRRDTVNAEFGGLVNLDTTVAEMFSETLKHTPRLGMEHVEKWVEYWESMGFFKSIQVN